MSEIESDLGRSAGEQQFVAESVLVQHRRHQLGRRVLEAVGLAAFQWTRITKQRSEMADADLVNDGKAPFEAVQELHVANDHFVGRHLTQSNTTVDTRALQCSGVVYQHVEGELGVGTLRSRLRHDGLIDLLCASRYQPESASTADKQRRAQRCKPADKQGGPLCCRSIVWWPATGRSS